MDEHASEEDATLEGRRQKAKAEGIRKQAMNGCRRST
jgi:hypothetical protein